MRSEGSEQALMVTPEEAYSETLIRWPSDIYFQKSNFQKEPRSFCIDFSDIRAKIPR